MLKDFFLGKAIQLFLLTLFDLILLAISTIGNYFYWLLLSKDSFFRNIRLLVFYVQDPFKKKTFQFFSSKFLTGSVMHLKKFF